MKIPDNHNAFRDFVETYSDQVYRNAFRFFQDETLAKEAAQLTFIKVWKSRSAFKGTSKISTYLYTICYRTCIDLQKKESRIAASELESNQSSVQEDSHTIQLDHFLNQLSEQNRYLLHLFYFEDYSIKEICNIVGKSESATKTSLSRARAQLKLIIEEAKEHEGARN